MAAMSFPKRTRPDQKGSLKPGGSGRPLVILDISLPDAASALVRASLMAAASRSSSIPFSDGCISESIAEKLGLSVHTVNAYLGTATTKLDAVNRVQAIAKAIRLGYIR